MVHEIGYTQMSMVRADWSVRSSNLLRRLALLTTSRLQVIEHWEQLRRVKNFEEVAGVVLFQQ